ncbi:hypothetical protein [Streptomyces sp. NPDC048111]|uniref:hypothetical protein n=1 Tax=Streptomyces sp. NPDC048111 TaxID=3365500 RepID=UPI00371B5D23
MVRDVVADQAPHELPLLDGLAGIDDGRLTQLFADSERREALLGFGITEVAGLVTPVVWMAVDETARRAVRSTLDASTRRLSVVARRLLRRPLPSPQAVTPLTSAQLSVVHQRVRELARASAIEVPQAQALADAVVSRLAREGERPPAEPAPAIRPAPETEQSP